MMTIRGVTLPDLRPFALIGVRAEIVRLRDEIARLEFIALTLAGELPENPPSPKRPGKAGSFSVMPKDAPIPARVDELHTHTDRAVIDVMETATARRPRRKQRTRRPKRRR